MAFIDEVRRSLTNTGKQVAKKTKEISDTYQLKSQIAAENEKIQKFCGEIGRKIFEEANEEDEKRFSAEFEFIRECLARKKEMEEQLADMDGSIFCTQCGAKIDKNALFCSRCGAKVKKDEPEAKAEELPKELPVIEEETEDGEA